MNISGTAPRVIPRNIWHFKGLFSSTINPQQPTTPRNGEPDGSMYGIYANIGGILMVTVTIYTILWVWKWYFFCLWLCVWLLWLLFPLLLFPTSLFLFFCFSASSLCLGFLLLRFTASLIIQFSAFCSSLLFMLLCFSAFLEQIKGLKPVLKITEWIKPKATLHKPS